jgi:beta-glucanase (GH16 family)
MRRLGIMGREFIMRRAFILCVLAVSLAVSIVAPSVATTVTVTMEQPQLTSASTAVLKGTVTGRKSVSIEQLVGTRWRSVQTAAADRAGHFQATVPATQTPVWYRATAGKVASEEVQVQAAPVPPPAEPQDACGPQPRKADGSRWSCTLAEDFSGTELNRSLWVPQTIFHTGTDSTWACYLDDPSVISVRDGALHLTVRKLSQGIACPGNKSLQTPYVAGMVSTYGLFSQQYGRFEARIKNTATSAPGLQEAFWLWPDDRYSTGHWPAAGEIDIVETYSQYPDLAIPFLHYTANDNGGPVPGLNTAWNCVAKRGEFNTYTLEWTATRIEILVNGTSCLVNTSGDPAFNKRYIIALTQALGIQDNAYDGRAPLPATMTVDYVRVWE